MSGIYIHIPFCKQACTYCDFHFSVNASQKQAMIDAMLNEITLRQNYLPEKKIKTIYFGGGTPSLLTINEIESIIEKLNNYFNWSTQAEITLECNPDDLTKTKLQALKNIGINRLSIGLQSFNAEELKWMNRAHSAEESVLSVLMAQEVGFENISIDLIYGSKFQSVKSWESTLHKALSLQVQHISAYNLTIENKTKLGLLYKKGSEPAVNDDMSAKQFKLMIEKLEDNAFVQYEISNFGKEGFFSQHNSNYWLNANYMGIGPSAHSFNGSKRQWNISNNTQYVAKINNKQCFFEQETLSVDQRYNEYILTRLRTIWGCSKNEIINNFGITYANVFNQAVLKHTQYLNHNNGKVTLNLNGKLMADYLASEFFV